MDDKIQGRNSRPYLSKVSIQMNKTDALKLSWVPIVKRLPPDEDFKIEVWNFISQEIMLMDCFIARLAAIAILENKGEKLSWDRQISHWRKMVGPK